MLRRLNIQVLNNPGNIWPISVSLLLHIIFLMLIAMPHAPKVPEFITIEFKSMPQFSAAALASKSAPGQNAAPASLNAAKPQPIIKNAEIPEPVKQVSAAASVVQKAANVHASASAQSTTSGERHSASSAKGAVSSSKAGSAASTAPVEGVFGAFDGPSFAHSVQPVYPRMARKLEREGTVLLRISLDEKGSLTSVVVVEKAGHGFDESAMNAVKASRFRAAKQHGVAVACRALLPIRFKLEG